MTAAALRVENLDLKFGAGGGLRDLNFAVDPGQRLVLLGPSGVGKTTILRVIAGLAGVAGGRILVDGREVTDLPPERRETVYLHQTPLLFPHLTVFENVAFSLRLRPTPEGDIRRRVRQLLDDVRLGAYGERRAGALSGGQRHRVALARALAARPRVLLLDEPLAALDPLLREEVRGAIVRLHEAAGTAVVLVTHDLADALTLGHSVGVILDGRLAGPLPPGELIRHPPSLAVAQFCGLPNLVPGRVDRGAFHSPLGVLLVPATELEGPATAVFPADALRPAAGGPILGVVRLVRHQPTVATQQVEVGGRLFETLPSWPAVSPGTRVALALDPDLVTLFPGHADV